MIVDDHILCDFDKIKILVSTSVVNQIVLNDCVSPILAIKFEERKEWMLSTILNPLRIYIK